MTSKLIAALMVAGLLTAGLAHAQEVTPTDRNVDLYGYATDFALEPGDSVSAYAASGVLCGRCTVRLKDTYGYLHVYGDDPATAQVEGARPGEAITLRVNGVAVSGAGPQQPVWTRDSDRLHVDLKR